MQTDNTQVREARRERSDGGDRERERSRGLNFFFLLSLSHSPHFRLGSPGLYRPAFLLSLLSLLSQPLLLHTRGRRPQRSLLSLLPASSRNESNGRCASKRAPPSVVSPHALALKEALAERRDTRRSIRPRGRPFSLAVLGSCLSLSFRDSPRSRNLSSGTEKDPERA